MAEVMQSPPTPDGLSLYQSSGRRRSPPATSALFLDRPPLSTSPNGSTYLPPAAEPADRGAPSPPASLPPSPCSATLVLDSLGSPASTPASSASSIEQKYGPASLDMDLPDYSGARFACPTADLLPAASPADECVEPPPPPASDSNSTRSDSPLPTPTHVDDTAIQDEPRQHVDYLSHDWREEDIWSSWRHIVSQRKVYGQRSRLENASWRTWAKSKYHLRTVSPETLNWLKESDVTWLYGPLKPAESHLVAANQSEPASQLSKNNSFLNKKPILKKRSMSEVMLQRSISGSSLVKRAAASVQAQQQGGGTGPAQRPKPGLQRASSDFVSVGFDSEMPSRDHIDYFVSQSSSSDDGTPYEFGSRRHIRFDDKVEQCIAVDCKEGEFDDLSDSESDDDAPTRGSVSDSSSDDGVVMMKPPPKRPGQRADGKGSARESRSNSHSGRKTIETLPATTLKYRADSSDGIEPAAPQHHTFGRNWGSRTVSPSPSQETLRPSHPSRNYLLGEDDGEPAEPTAATWSFGASNPKSSLGAASPTEELDAPRWGRRDPGYGSSRARSGTPWPPRDDADDADGFERAAGGMLMPYDADEEDDMMAVGLFGRVSETINTAKDIAHVIWNVGWRK